MGDNSSCYNEDGTPSDDVPCGFSSLSTCCASDWDCLSNGLCRQHGTTSYSQGTCTDPDFKNCLAFCRKSQFDGFTEVSRCDPTGNSWCCAGAAGQGLGGPDCCTTDLVTSLNPFPFSVIERLAQSEAATSSSSISSLPLLQTSSSSTSSTTSSSSSSTTSSSSSSTTSSSTSSATSLSSSTIPQSPTPTPTNSTPSQPTNDKNPSMTGIEVGVPMAILIIILASLLLFFFLRKLRNQGRGPFRPQSDKLRDDPSQYAEMNGEDARGELDITYYEVAQPAALRHELPNNVPRHELG